MSEPIDLVGLPISPIVSADEVERMLSTAWQGGGCAIATFVNPASRWVADRHPGYVSTLAAHDLVLCDGIGAVLAARWLTGIRVSRLSFDSTSLAPWFFHTCATDGREVFLIGAAEGVAATAARVLETAFPGLKIVGAVSGFLEAPEAAIELIKRSGAQAVVCGMGAPRQEAFLVALKHSGWCGVAVTCGGYLDQLGRGMIYYPAWVDRWNLRFAYRLYREPRRLWRRYLLEYLPFFHAVLGQRATRLLADLGTGRRSPGRS